jgi:hypothetical protein
MRQSWPTTASKMETILFSETLRRTQPHNPEDDTRQLHRCEDLKFRRKRPFIRQRHGRLCPYKVGIMGLFVMWGTDGTGSESCTGFDIGISGLLVACKISLKPCCCRLFCFHVDAINFLCSCVHTPCCSVSSCLSRCCLLSSVREQHLAGSSVSALKRIVAQRPQMKLVQQWPRFTLVKQWQRYL